MTNATPHLGRPVEGGPLQVGRIEVLDNEVAIGQAGRWEPVAGTEAIHLLNRKLEDLDQQREVLSSARDVLSRCVPPTDNHGSHTELVIGYVQSGKTLSFTTVIALARDNNFRFVIVLSGVTKELATQSKDRLLEDLAIHGARVAPWHHLHNPRLDRTEEVRNVLAEWREAGVPADQRRTVLITVLKNHANLRHLHSLLQALGPELQVPALVVDDEADQASLNNLIRQGRQSTTYRRIQELRQALPQHSYLEYTATPQATLLINLFDLLSPETVILLNPGRDYVGGKEFTTVDSPFVRVIPDADIPERDAPFPAPPDSLKEALRLFFVGVASGYVRRDYEHGRNRSMMIHPSQFVASHRVYGEWVRSILSLWIATLAGEVGAEDRQELVDEFRVARDALSQTVAELEGIGELTPHILLAMRRTELRVVNSDAEVREIEWRRAYPWILIGGQVLDRGFTVEGLTITYMPRGRGVGNADTLQQRARFLGYKRRYLGYCRVFLEREMRKAYADYSRHEEELRRSLREFARSGRPLSEFRRLFILDPAMELTRRTVIDIDYHRLRLTANWYSPVHAALVSESYERNRELVRQFTERFASGFVEMEGHPDRTAIQRHTLLAGLPLRVVHENLLADYLANSEQDEETWLVVLAAISRLLADHPESTGGVILMSRGLERRRSIDPESHEIRNLFQGAYPVEAARRGEIYPGDRAIVTSDQVTVQVHSVTLHEGSIDQGRIIAEEVPLLTLHFRTAFVEDLVVQPQGGVVA